MALTTIGDRITPSIPIQITFDAQTIASGTKVTTLIGHLAANNSVALPNTLYSVVNIGDPTAAKNEVNALAGAGSQIGNMAYAFVADNALVGRSNFPAFQVLFLANNDLSINANALTALSHSRSDMIVSCYPASDASAMLLQNLALQMSGPDRDLQGQFGSFVTIGSLDNVQAVQGYNFNSRAVMIASLPDSNNALVNVTANAVANSNVLQNVSSVVGVYPGASLSGPGLAAGTVVVSAANGSITMNQVPTTAGTGIAVAVQNQVSQPAEIVAAAHAGGLMASAFPYNPVKGVGIGGLVPPQIMSDRVQIDPFGSSEALLKAGVSPLYVAPGGVVSFLKTVTTYHLLPDGVTHATDYTAWQQLVTLNDFAEDLYQITQNPPFNNNPGGTKASLDVANALLGEMVRLAKNFEDQGAFQGVNSLAKLFKVQPSTLRRGRFDCRIPVNVLPDLDTIAINIVATTMFDFTL